MLLGNIFAFPGGRPVRPTLAWFRLAVSPPPRPAQWQALIVGTCNPGLLAATKASGTYRSDPFRLRWPRLLPCSCHTQHRPRWRPPVGCFASRRPGFEIAKEALSRGGKGGRGGRGTRARQLKVRVQSTTSWWLTSFLFVFSE